MLRDKHILVVEDDTLIAMMVEDYLDDLGARVVGPALTTQQALKLIDEHPVDAAILDVNLGAERSDSVAHRLRNRGIPFVFATGYGTHAVEGLGESEVIAKPYRQEHLASALQRALCAL